MLVYQNDVDDSERTGKTAAAAAATTAALVVAAVAIDRIANTMNQER